MFDSFVSAALARWRQRQLGPLILLAVLPVSAAAQPEADGILERLKKLLDGSPNPALVVAVAKDRELLIEAGMGLRDVETGRPADAHMMFRNGSTTKMMVAAALLEALLEQQFNDSMPLAEIVDGLHPAIGRLTVRDLLTHTSGLADKADDFGLHDETALATNVEGKSAGDFFVEPGQVFSYSNPGYDIAGHVFAKLSGERFADAFRARILAPAGMSRSMFRATMAMTYPFALPHGQNVDGAIEVMRPMPDNAAEWPSGLMYTTVGDLARFAIVLMHGGVAADGTRVLGAQTVRSITTPRVSIPGDRQNAQYGFGVEVMIIDGELVWHHTGGIAGFVTHLTLLPEQKLAVALMTNGPDGDVLADAADYLLDAYAGIRLTLPERSHALLDPAVIPTLAGDYGQLAVELRLRARGGHLVSIDDSGERDGIVHAIDGDDFVIVRPRNDPVHLHVSWGAGGEPKYLHRGARALLRLNSQAANGSTEN